MALSQNKFYIKQQAAFLHGNCAIHRWINKWVASETRKNTCTRASLWKNVKLK